MFMIRPILLAGIVMMAGWSSAFAGGLGFTELGAAASGKANAFVAEANDPSALFYNPAGITQLPGTQLMAGLAIPYLRSEYLSSTTGQTTQLQDHFPLVPHLYLTHQFPQWDGRITVGLGIFHPFGIMIDWPDNWQGRFNTTNARLRVSIYNPTVALRVTPKLSVAAGMQIADVAAEFEQKLNLQALGLGESKVRGHGLTAHPVGWNVGTLYHITETTSVGVTFRSELQAKLRGQADFTGPASAIFANSGVRSRLKLPPEIVGGLSTKFIPRWTFNADIVWTGWRTLGTLPKDFDGAVQSALDSPGERLWENSMTYRAGVEYAFTDRAVLRGGYFYEESPIPAKTFDPTIPNANLHAVTAGVGYRWNRCTVDLAYLFGFYEKRTIDSSTIEITNQIPPTTFGSYRTTAQVLTMSVTVRF